jgi:hypothetical protein
MVFSQVLIDAQRQIRIDHWQLTAEDIPNYSAKRGWKVVKRRLAGGRQDGVDVVEIDNGALKFMVVPTRGCNLWSGQIGALRLGWDSPVQEIVHPNYVNLSERGGLGWLNGYGEWISRCGLESIGAPCLDGNKPLTLHGRINYLPASYLELRFEEDPRPKLILRGVVHETMMFGTQLRLTTDIITEVGSSAVTLDDQITNLADAPQEMQTLYHINFGPPLLGKGAWFHAPVESVFPRDERAVADGMADWNGYRGPQPAGYTEQVHLLKVFADQQGMSEAALISPSAENGVSVIYNIRQLPCLTLWKNEAPLKTGYVTGLEPATSFPYPKPIERAKGRVPVLSPETTYRTAVTITGLLNRVEVEAALARIKQLQRAEPQINTAPMS